MVDMKKCSKCGETKPLSEFNKNQCWCRECQAKYAKQYRKDNRDKILADKKRYYKANHGKILERCKRYREKNLECSKQYHKANRDEILAKKKIQFYERKNNGLCTKCGKRQTIEHSTVLCEICYLKKQSYRALGTVDNWMFLGWLLEEQHYRCALTNELLVLGNTTSVDHIKSISTHPELASNPSNIQWLTRSANSRKRNNTNEEALITKNQRKKSYNPNVSIIYAIHRKHDKKIVYIGETIVPMYCRKNGHKHDALIKNKTSPINKVIREQGWDVFEFVVLTDKYSSRFTETYFTNLLKPEHSVGKPNDIRQTRFDTDEELQQYLA